MEVDSMSKKRKLNEIMPIQPINPKNKVRRLNDGESEALLNTVKSSPRPKLTLNEMSWDILNLIMRFSPKQPVYGVLRGVNKQFYYLKL